MQICIYNNMCNDVSDIQRKQSLPRNITISRILVYTESSMDVSMNAQEEVSSERCPQELSLSDKIRDSIYFGYLYMLFAILTIIYLKISFQNKMFRISKRLGHEMRKKKERALFLKKNMFFQQGHA